MQQTVRLSCVVATALWVFAFLLTLAGTIALSSDRLYLGLGLYAHTMLAIGAAAVMSLRAVAERQTRTIVNHLDIGRDLGVTHIKRNGL